MTFITIKEAISDFMEKQVKNSSFIGTIIKEGDLSSGKGAKGDWTRKVFTFEDSSDSIELTAWNDQIKLFKIGCKYEIIKPVWSDYEGRIQLGLGNWGVANLIGNAKIQSTMDDSEIKPEPKGQGSVNGEKLDDTNENFRAFIVDENMAIAQITQIVSDEMMRIQGNEQINGQIVGLRVKEIYRESKRVNFKKASSP